MESAPTLHRLTARSQIAWGSVFHFNKVYPSLLRFGPPWAASFQFDKPSSLHSPVVMLPNTTAPTGRALLRLAKAGKTSAYSLPNAPTSKGVGNEHILRIYSTLDQPSLRSRCSVQQPNSSCFIVPPVNANTNAPLQSARVNQR